MLVPIALIYARGAEKRAKFDCQWYITILCVDDNICFTLYQCRLLLCTNWNTATLMDGDYL